MPNCLVALRQRGIGEEPPKNIQSLTFFISCQVKSKAEKHSLFFRDQQHATEGESFELTSCVCKPLFSNTSWVAASPFALQQKQGRAGACLTDGAVHAPASPSLALHHAHLQCVVLRVFKLRVAWQGCGRITYADCVWTMRPVLCNLWARYMCFL